MANTRELHPASTSSAPRLAPWALAFCTLLFLSNADSQTGACISTWDPPVRISHDSLPSIRPRLAVSGDTLYIFWYGLDTLGTVAADGIQYSVSYDGGRTFSPERVLVSMDTAFAPGLVAAAGNTVYVTFLAAADTFYGTALMRSTDAGATWGPIQRLARGTQPVGITAMDSFVDVQSADPARGLHTSLHSTDFGISYSVNRSPGLRSLVSTRNALHALSVESSERTNEIGYWYSDNLGFDWFGPELISREDPVNSDLPSLAVNGQENLFASWNDDGTIMFRRSLNAGYSWIGQVSLGGGGGAQLSSVGSDEEFVCVAWDLAAGSGIAIRGSNNFGQTFCSAESITTGRSCGEPSLAIRGTILHAVWWEDPDGVNREIMYRRAELTPNPDLPNGPPRTFRLRQNYPNPFNAVTHIVYDVPKPAHVRVTIFNVLGELISTLVDEFQPTRRYDLPFDMGGYPSGMYFYRLTAVSEDNGAAESFTEVKKLLLIR